MKKLFEISLIMILLSGLFQIRIFAESTYIDLPKGSDPTLTFKYIQTNINKWQYYYVNNPNNLDVRMTYLNIDGYIYPFFVSLQSGTLKTYRGTEENPSSFDDNLNLNSKTYNGITFYYNYTQSMNYNGYYQSDHTLGQNIAITQYTGSNWSVESPILAYRVTYGDLAEDPSPVINYGLLDMHYSANINPGLIESSVDHIVSNGYDVNGNDLSGNILQIRAIPGYYTDESRELINQLNVTDFVRQDDALYVVYSDVITHENKIDLEWSQVVQHFPPGIRWYGFVPYLDPVEEVYYARGWIYEYCVTNLDGDTLIDWTRIYNTTGMPPSVTTPIVSSDNLNPDLVNAIEVINNINNNTENWYLQNIEINMTNSQGSESTQKPWWAYLLEAILGFLNNILDTILKLFQFDSFELPNFESEHQNLINNTGMFGETIQFESQIQDLISSATYTDPVLYYPGLQLDGVNLIPEVNINLNDYVNQLGLTDLQQIAYIVTDGSIYLSLFLLIKNKLMEILKK